MASTSKSRNSAFLAGLAIVMIAAGGVAHGLVTDRWGMPADVANSASRVQSLPATIGTWKSTNTPLDQRQLEMAGAVGAVSRTYEDSTTGEKVQIHLLAGRPGPISLHEPTVCFAGAGLNQVEAVSKHRVAGNTDEVQAQFSKTLFLSPRQNERGLLTLWTWSPDGKVWTAPEHPRSAFAGNACLYKLYVITDSARESVGDSKLSPTAEAFVSSLLDAVHSVVAETPHAS